MLHHRSWLPITPSLHLHAGSLSASLNILATVFLIKLTPFSLSFILFGGFIGDSFALYFQWIMDLVLPSYLPEMDSEYWNKTWNTNEITSKKITALFLHVRIHIYMTFAVISSFNRYSSKSFLVSTYLRVCISIQIYHSSGFMFYYFIIHQRILADMTMSKYQQWSKSYFMYISYFFNTSKWIS